MKDTTDKNNELDQYGVWVKTPPHTSSDAPSANQDSILPDFSFMDADATSSPSSNSNTFDTDETSLTPDELSRITGSVDDTAKQKDSDDQSSTKEEEISLDDFITGGFSDAPTEEKTEPAAPASSSSDGDISLDEFLGPDSSSDTTISSKPDGEISLDEFMDAPSATSNQKQDDVIDEKPMDIDLSFDDSLTIQDDNTQESETNEPAVEEAEPSSTEEVDLSSFDKSESAPAKKDSTGIDLDNFDSLFDTIVDESSSDKASTPKTDESTETVDLSAFGIDDTAEDSGKTASISATPNETVDYSMNVITDDDVATAQPIATTEQNDSDKEESIAIETQSEESAAKATVDTAEQFSSPDDDFDVDSIMNSVKDEQGKTVCIGKTADAITKDIDTVELEEAPVQEPVVPEEQIEDLNQTDSITIDDSLDTPVPETIPESIPDSFEEESSSLTSEIEKPVVSEDIPSDNFTTNNEEISAFLPDDISNTIEIPVASDNESSVSDAFISKDNKQLDDISAELPEEKPFEASSSSTPNEIDETSNQMLKQIADELSSLKDEINGLKTEFADLKKNNVPSPQPIKVVDEEKSTGFFSGTDEDDTIALSGDELDNILNNADFTTAKEVEDFVSDVKPAATSTTTAPATPTAAAVEPTLEAEKSNIPPETDLLGTMESAADIPEQDDYDNAPTTLKMDFSTEHLEEPKLDDLDFGTPVSENTSDATSEKDASDDILVESSNTDLINTDVTNITDNAPVEEAAPVDELLPEDDSTAKAEIITSDTISKPIDLFKDDEPSPLTDEKINYLASDEKIPDSTPVDTVFSQWDNEPSATAAETESKPVADGTIPSDMKQEIKSVLSYMDQLLESLPEDKITEFAQSEQFETYKKLFTELGLA